MTNAFDYIREKVPQAELLAQLAEEASELTHAALKLRRACDGTNPTPVSPDEALANLREEVADVMLLLEVLQLGMDAHLPEYYKTRNAKLDRWVLRLAGAEPERLYWKEDGPGWVCPACGYSSDDPYYLDKFCPGCGERIHFQNEREGGV